MRARGDLPERYAHRRVAAPPSTPYAATAVVIDRGDVVAEVAIPELDLRFAPGPAAASVAELEARGHRPQDAGRYLVTFAHTADGPIEATTTAPLLLPTGRRPTAWARHIVCWDNRMWMQFGDDRTRCVLKI